MPLKELEDNQIIWAGTRVRLYGIGLNVVHKSDDFNEYLVSYIYDNDDNLQLTNLSQGEAGNIICIIKKDKPNHYSKASALKLVMHLEQTYVMLE
ncbi:hypothetical protein GE073_04915 [Paenibacillus sp. B01]|nr:hypothetical protein [Paenibacillus sp. B01]QGG58600.1 hypothetical protein GE073_04915 [Paenibacillus sp. B01]